MQIIPDHLILYLQLKALGTFFSAIAYGIVIVLSGNCIYCLQKKRGIHSNYTRILLLTYVVVMLLLSTLTLFQSICQIVAFMFPPEILPIDLMYLPITLPLTIWGANGFMVRILMLARSEGLQCNFRYGVVSPCIRACLIALEF